MRRRTKATKKATSRPSSDRKMLIAYLQYAVDDLAILSGTSAILVSVAIEHLKREPQFPQRLRP